MKRMLAVLLAVVVAVLSITSCSNYRHKQWRTNDQSAVRESNYTLRFIEADDEGWFWDPRQATDALQHIRDEVAQRDTIVVTFVHGWHHSAEPCDDNVEGFRLTLERLHALRPGFNIVGLYVGWRGRSLPMALDYATFWGRKGAAERVGQNDLQEFLFRLQQLFLDMRPDARGANGAVADTSAPSPPHFLGLVTLGHSFGAQVLLKAITGSLEAQLQQLNPSPAYLRGATPAQPTGEQTHTVSGVGDLVVLINPAAEASQYHRLHVLSQGLSYSSLQTPVILTVSAENDRSRHRLFTLGRILGEIFTGKPHKDDEIERTVEREALGVYRGHVTHLLAPTDDSVELVEAELPENNGSCTQRHDALWHEWETPPSATRPNSLSPNAPALRTFDFSRDVVFNNVALSALTESSIRNLGEPPEAYATALPYQPFIVARASRKIIDDHSGFFTQPFLDFLIPYIAYIEEKSKLNVQSKTELKQIERKSAK